MTQKARQSQSSSKAVVHPVVLFGVDRHGKPTAARFPESQASLAAKAAEQLHLRVLTVATPAVAELCQIASNPSPPVALNISPV
jgi:hypothetical protein